MSEDVKLFQPCNGTHGEIFMSQHCFKCAKWKFDENAKGQCLIFLRTLFHSTDEPEYPNEWRYVDGEPTCTAFKCRDEFNAERREKRKLSPRVPHDDKTLDLFEAKT